MKLKNVLLVVNDIEKSKAFYKEILGLYVVSDFGENVIMSEGVVLQEKNIWKKLIKKDVTFSNNATELYFEDKHFDDFLERLEKSSFNIKYVNKISENQWGKKVIRIYDPDMHIIEVCN